MKKMMAVVLAASLGAGASTAMAGPAEKSQPAPRCFRSSELQNWKAADAKTIYIRVGMHRYYRLDLTAPCPSIRSPGAFLVTKIHGTSTICSAIDLDLHVATSWRDIPQACIVKKITELTPAEAKALPKKVKP